MDGIDKQQLLTGEQDQNEKNQFDKKVHEEGQDESEDSDDWEGNSDDNEDDEDLDDYEHDIQDDILKPASTRSKIVVNLKEYKDKNGKRRPFTKDDPIEYQMDRRILYLPKEFEKMLDTKYEEDCIENDGALFMHHR